MIKEMIDKDGISNEFLSNFLSIDLISCSLGAGGRRFKSCHPKKLSRYKMKKLSLGAATGIGVGVGVGVGVALNDYAVGLGIGIAIVIVMKFAIK